MTKDEIEAIIIPILTDMDFFVAENDQTTVYVRFKNAYKQPRLLAIEDEVFLSYVYDTFCAKADVFIAPPLEGYIKYFQRYAVAHSQENKIELNRRIAGNLQNSIGYFLANDSWQTVVIRPTGWRIGVSKHFHFLRMPSDLAQSLPVPGGDLLQLLRPYVNLNDDDFLLFTIHLVQCFSKSSAHFAMVLTSDKGTGKTTTSKLFRALVDPSQSDVNPLSKSEDELKVLLANNYVVCIDNANRGVSENYSNILCSAITGAVESRRKLYTTSEQVLLTLRNIVLINGLNAVPRKSDLAQRSLVFVLQPIEDSSRKSDSAFWSAFNKDKPKILGAIFDTLVKAMKSYPTLKLEKRHRMAECYEEMSAISSALGISQDKFDLLLLQNNNRMQQLRADDPFVDAIKNFMSNKKELTASVSSIYTAVRDGLVGSTKSFPLSPSAFSRRLNDERESLWASGIEFVITDGADANKITIVNKNLRRKKRK